MATVDPIYLRRQAELCLAIAGLMSSPADAKVARQAADQYLHRAEQAEVELKEKI